MSIPTDARQVRTRERLRGALLRLLETRAFEQVTIREIALASGVSYPTFFRHYPSRESLLHEVAAGQIGELLERALPVLFSADRHRSCAILFETILERRALWSVLLTGGAANMLKQEFVAQARRAADRQGPSGGWLPEDLRITFAVSATVEILAWWLQRGAVVGTGKMAEILDRLVVAPAMAFE